MSATHFYFVRNINALLVFCVVVIFAPIVSAEVVLHLQVGDIEIKDLKSNSEFILNSDPELAFQSLGENPAFKRVSKYFVLQFANSISAQDELALKELNFEILRYIPDNAYLVRGEIEQITKVQNKILNFIDYAPYQPQIRISPELKVRSIFNRDTLQQVRLQLFAGVSADSLAEELISSGVTVLSVADSVLEVSAPTSQLNRLAAIEGVEWVSKKSQMKLQNYVFEEHFSSLPSKLDVNKLSGYETGTKIMGFQNAWNAGLRGKGQIVGVADSGLDTGNISTMARDFSNLKSAYVFGIASSSWADYIGHGTHVTGSVGGSGEQSDHIVMGGANEAEIIMESLWSQKVGNLTTPSDLGVIFEQAYKVGARIQTNSWGEPESQGIYNADSMQVDQFVWDHPDMLILFAVGNEGVDADRDGRIDPGAVSSPSTAKNIISIGASENLVVSGGVQRKLGEISGAQKEKPWPVNPIASDMISNNPQGIAAFSSRGPTQDGRIKPDLVAPGSNILSNCSKMDDAKELWGRFNKNYCWAGGTSMSTPLAAGAAAIVREHLIKNEKIEQPSAAIIKAVLLHTAVDLYPGQYGEVGKSRGQELLNPGPNFDQGYGRVDVGRATAVKMSYVDEQGGLATGTSQTHSSSGSVRKVTLVYNDAPASPSVKKALVNNLDLEVQVNGKSYWSKSTVDNSEQVTLPLGQVTKFASIIVHATNVPMGKAGKQPYALVFSNSL